MTETCPVCRLPARITDWRGSSLEWACIEECACNGFFVWGGLLDDGRLFRLTAIERQDLIRRIREFRAMGLEAWCLTMDGTVDGFLVVRTARPA